MSNKCTWQDCKNKATQMQIARDGEMWANLCLYHHDYLLINTDDPKKLAAVWIKAQGGSHQAAERFK